MLLETLDIRKKDVMIFSQNRFDFNNNFRIIYKSQKIKRPQKISYFDVCEIVKDPIPKNLIVYRLLTNVTELDGYSTKYGYFIKVNGKLELIYFDPVFAIKDIRHLRFDFDPELFRFKIQQVGLTSTRVQGLEADYDEVFGFDLKAHEAQNQNDKIFADAIFAFDDSYIDDDVFDEDDIIIEKKLNAELARDFKSEGITRLENISEEKSVLKEKLTKPHFEDDASGISKRDEKVEMLKKAMGIKLIPNSITQNEEIPEQKSAESVKEPLFDLFKSTAKFSDIESRKNQSFILKLQKNS
ncbi:hypothetical protein ASZ90_005258 [hydrocarbon metagenome]|uniref:Uncharacterized protein n=1 Tax=hydrocarbon metagenome TaxID=938273 RepID=A0A0W8FXD6_9ZZZZ